MNVGAGPGPCGSGPGGGPSAGPPGPYQQHNHPATPQSAVASPGAASLNSMHEQEFADANSPSWPRTPASPVSILFFILL